MLGIEGVGGAEKRIGEATYTDDPFVVGGFNLLGTLRDASHYHAGAGHSAGHQMPASAFSKISMASAAL